MIGLRTLINENCTINDALIMGADYYETLEECALVPGCLPIGLGESLWLRSALAALLVSLPWQPMPSITSLQTTDDCAKKLVRPFLSWT